MKRALLALLTSCLVSQSMASETDQPNIIFIFADDWGWGDLSCHDHPYVKTPNIDRLANEGADFTRFTVASPVCSPSRTAVMTGHYPSRYAVDGHFAWVPDNAKRGMPDWVDTEAPSLPRMLREAGYATAHFGKWHLSNNMIPDSPSLLEYGYDEYGAFNCSGEQMPYDHDVDRSIAFIDRVKEQPFFINLWIHEPHTPFHVIPKYRQMFPHIENEADNIYAATLAYADERIGKLLDYLDNTGLAENTLVVFSSDNGPARAPGKKDPKLIYDSATGAGFDTGAAKGITAGRKGWKASLHEGGLNVPFLVRWPAKIKAGAVDSETFISAVDLLPTFVSIAGGSLPKGYTPDGIDYTSALLGTPAPERTTPLFSRYSPWGGLYTQHWASYVVVDGGYKYLTTPDYSRQELYHLTNDPLEEHNVLAEQESRVNDLKKKLEAWLKTLPDGPSGKVFSSLRDQ